MTKSTPAVTVEVCKGDDYAEEGTPALWPSIVAFGHVAEDLARHR